MNGFNAMLHRMHYINRWGLMRNARAESLSEHTLDTAYITHILAVVGNARFNAGVDPARMVCYALYHDVAEILTGDLPTPVKYSNAQMRAEYKKIECEAEQRLVGMLPADLAEDIAPALDGGLLSERERRILKAADKLSALIKCVEEENAGNTEFIGAKAATLRALRDDPLPETLYFLEECIPAYTLTLDALMAL